MKLFLSALIVLMVVLPIGCCRVERITEVRYVDRPAEQQHFQPQIVPPAPVYFNPQPQQFVPQVPQVQQPVIQPTAQPSTGLPPDGPVAADGSFIHYHFVDVPNHTGHVVLALVCHNDIQHLFNPGITPICALPQGTKLAQQQVWNATGQTPEQKWPVAWIAVTK